MILMSICEHCNEQYDSPKCCTFCYPAWEKRRKARHLNRLDPSFVGLSRGWVHYIDEVVPGILNGTWTLSLRYYQSTLANDARNYLITRIEEMTGVDPMTFERCRCLDCHRVLVEHIEQWIEDNAINL